ncbi:MAG: hypothetical protein IKQ61_13375 [Spirochaetales bacterium]|nr:hypothetical protein [Spirochaetales bacterium]
MRYKKLNDEEIKKYFDYYVNIQLIGKVPAVGDIAYEGVINGKKTVFFDTDYRSDSNLTPIGIVFEVKGIKVKIVSLYEKHELEWCTKDAEGYNKDLIGDSEITEKINLIGDWDIKGKYPAFDYVKSLGKGWYLPGRDEMGIIFKMREHIKDGLRKMLGYIYVDKMGEHVYEEVTSGIRIEYKGLYWTSGCSYGVVTEAYCCSLGDNGYYTGGDEDKTTRRSVRAVRDIVL